VIVPSRELMPLIRTALENGQRVRMTATGSSMLPFIRDNDTVELEPINRSPVLGDVVLALGPDGQYLLHRIVGIKGDGYFLRGDAQRHCEGPFLQSDLLGRITSSVRDGNARAHDRGVWRLAGIAWVCCNPLGFRLLRLADQIRKTGAKALLRLHSIPCFRALIKRFSRTCTIREAGVADMMALYSWLNPDGNPTPPPAEPNLTNYVAKRGNELIGFVRLMRHPETDFPYVGYWLYSLSVKSRYRGMGFGEALTRRVIDQAMAEGSDELFLAVFEDNRPAVDLYLKLGFEHVTLPVIEEEFAAEGRRNGRRRVVMRRRFSDIL
jgi:ribosomal protein S18 acetylase RimI-like enzyme